MKRKPTSITFWFSNTPINGRDAEAIKSIFSSKCDRLETMFFSNATKEVVTRKTFTNRKITRRLLCKLNLLCFKYGGQDTWYKYTH